MSHILRSFICFFVIINIGCNDSPKVIQSVTESEKGKTVPIQSTGIFSDNKNNSEPDNRPISTDQSDMHTVKAIEILPAQRYVYVRVEEGENNYWIATSKQEVVEGQTYFYKGGLLKTNFESKEHNRIFDKIFLVSRIVPLDHGNNSNQVTNAGVSETKESNSEPTERVVVEGSVPIAEIVKNPDKYTGKEIQVSGKCVKINPNIMGRNWIHLQDGTQNDYDMVVTADIMVPEGHVVTMKGILKTDVDFGAGYRYDIIIEDGVVLKMQ
ncbi:MAG: hypothetical protein HKN68_06635 [Saprospiraceae bacterium]|nr:hypothetical protein [Saprospiraceae bacterium]